MGQFKTIEVITQKRTGSNIAAFLGYVGITFLIPVIIISVATFNTLGIFSWIPLMALALFSLVELGVFPHRTAEISKLYALSILSWLLLFIIEQSPLDALKLFVSIHVMAVAIHAPCALAWYFLKQAYVQKGIAAKLGIGFIGIMTCITTGPILLFTGGAYTLALLSTMGTMSAASVLIAAATLILTLVHLFRKDNYMQDIPEGAPTVTKRWRVPINTAVLGPHKVVEDDPTARILGIPTNK